MAAHNLAEVFHVERDGDLSVCVEAGIAWQNDMVTLVPYDADYLAKCAAKSDSPIAADLNAARVEFVERHYSSGRLCDIGIGSGDFIRARPNSWGHDINPLAVEWLTREGRLAKFLREFGAYTFWDVLEHVPEPGQYLEQVQLHAFVFASVPIHQDLTRIRESKHYRPGEHLWHWNEPGFVRWMEARGFALLERSDFETRLGRDNILTFAFRRRAWPSHG